MLGTFREYPPEDYEGQPDTDSLEAAQLEAYNDLRPAQEARHARADETTHQRITREREERHAASVARLRAKLGAGEAGTERPARQG